MWQLLGATGLKRPPSKIRRSWSLCDAWQQPASAGDACYMGSYSTGKMPRGTFEGNSSHDGDRFRGSRRRNAAGISAPRRRHQLDLLRLGRAALFHADHHFCICALFRELRRAGSGAGAGAVGICHRGRRPDDRAAVAGAGRDCRRQRPPQAVDRRLRRAAGDRRLADVVRKAGRPQRHPAAVARLCDRERRCRIRHRLQQRDDADAGAAGSNRAVVRHRMGHRLYRRHPQPHPGARLSGREPRYRAYAVRPGAAVRPRSGHPIRAIALPAR